MTKRSYSTILSSSVMLLVTPSPAMETSTSVASNKENGQEMEPSDITHAPDLTRKGLTGINYTSPKYKVIIIDGMAIVNAIPKTEIIMYAMILHKSFLTSTATWLAIT